MFAFPAPDITGARQYGVGSLYKPLRLLLRKQRRPERRMGMVIWEMGLKTDGAHQRLL